MAEKSGFFNATETSAGVYDRTYGAEDFANYFAMFIGSGVFMNPVNQLQVVPKTGLTVTVKAGKAFVDGYWYELDEDKDITLSANGTSVARTDLITCTLNKSSRTVISDKKENVRSTNPTNNGTIHELILAVISVGVGVSSITAANITDTRPDSSKCGFVGALIEQPDFSVLFDQMEAQFDEWFDEMKGQLTEDAAGNLQTQVDDLSQNKFDKSAIIKTKEGLMNVSQEGSVPDAMAIKSLITGGVTGRWRIGKDIPGNSTSDTRIYGRIGGLLFITGTEVVFGQYNGVDKSYAPFYTRGQLKTLINRCDPEFYQLTGGDLPRPEYTHFVIENGDAVETNVGLYAAEYWGGSLYDQYYIKYWPNVTRNIRINFLILYTIPLTFGDGKL